ncbi:WD40 repeat-like protein [Histomonas meleagridis]|uniref:WD40 repeat-like protein n=1 Tax=Histomonas meleagridis TaxID=135588 RepID=UPI00355955B7|nr:WD40 repeat-like protein [Histomonas meleagridis]KAH0797387.1 WD40 repeat-like protein [Histomonas meleagridis]
MGSFPDLTKNKKKAKMKIQVEWTTIQYDFSDSILCVHRSKDLLAFGLTDSSVILFSQQLMSKVGVFQGHKGCINDIITDPKTGLFAACSGDGTVSIWDFGYNDAPFHSQRKGSFSENITSNITLSSQSGPVLCGAWLPDNSHLVTGSGSNINFWDIGHSQTPTRIEALNSNVLCMDSSIDPSNVAFGAGLYTGEVAFYDTRVERSVFSVSHSKGQIVSCKFVQGNIPRMVSAGTDKSLRDWDLRFTADSKRSYDIDHVPTKIDVAQQYVAVPTETSRTRFINLERQSIIPLASMPFSYTVSSCAFMNDDASKLMCGSWDGTAAYAQISLNVGEQPQKNRS